MYIFLSLKVGSAPMEKVALKLLLLMLRLPIIILFSKIIPSFFTIKEGSTFLTKPLFPQGREDVTALLGAQDRYALRLADHQRSAPDFAGWYRLNNYLSFSLLY